ncbi:probable chitinase 10 [Ornithodoros turicata]|uniref:probable chitinase 10 n=1 Tax=Ornithodoros turicata TaxID=34597 RepID=UPI003138ADE8
MALSLRRERRQDVFEAACRALPSQAPPEKKSDLLTSAPHRVFRKQYGLVVAVVCVTAVGAAALFSFASRAQDDVRPKRHTSSIPTEISNDEPPSVVRQAPESSIIQDAPGLLQHDSQRNRSLLCRFSPRYQSGVYPYGLCTHLIYASVQNKDVHGNIKDTLFVYDPKSFRKFVHVRETSSDLKLLLSVSVDALLRGGTESNDRLAQDATAWLDSHGVDGLHVSGLKILPRNIENITGLLQALRKAFKKHLLTVGVDQTQKAVEPALMKLLRVVDFACFRTSRVGHADERTTLTNPYRKYDNSTSVLFLEEELEKLSSLAKRAHYSHLCFTLILGGNKFTLEDEKHHGLGAPARHIGDASYNEICNKKWDNVHYIEPAIGNYAYKGSTWISYETEKTIAAKVQLAMKKHPKFCIMLSQVDRDDYKGACSEKHFPLVQSVRHALYHASATLPASFKKPSPSLQDT